MLKSMTGYGRGEDVSRSSGKYSVEIHSVNRKYCDIIVNLPKNILVLESEIRKAVQKDITRGRINVYVNQERSNNGHRVFIDKDLVRQYFKTINNLKKELKLKGELDIGLLAGLKEIITYKEPDVDAQKAWPAVGKALKKALKAFDTMRTKEGAAISDQIEKPIGEVEDNLVKIKNLVPELADHFKQRLENKLKEVRADISSNDERIQKEMAILADHTDITEELNRMKSHIAQFRLAVKKNEPVGRTLDFLIQEMMREVNTMGSKAAHTQISALIVDNKTKLERVREQIQNVE